MEHINKNIIKIELILFIQQIIKEQFNNTVSISNEKIATYIDDNYIKRYFF